MGTIWSAGLFWRLYVANTTAFCHLPILLVGVFHFLIETVMYRVNNYLSAGVGFYDYINVRHIDSLLVACITQVVWYAKVL